MGGIRSALAVALSLILLAAPAVADIRILQGGTTGGGGGGAVLSVFARTGAVVGAQADYDSFFLTPAEADALYAPIGTGGSVASVFGRTGIVVALQTDYDSFFLTPAEANALYSALGHAHAAGDVTSGTFGVARGGTGLSSVGTANQLLGANAGATGNEYKSLVAGTNVTITHGIGTVTISASPPGGVAGVSSFNTRTGDVVSLQTDYDGFFTTPAEATAAAPVQTVFGRSGTVTGLAADYDAFFLTPAEGNAAYSVLGHPHATTDVTSGVFGIARGGTGLSALGTANQVLGVDAAGTGPEYKTITAGSNVTVTHGIGAVTIAAAADAVSSVFARTGAVVAAQADYDSFFLTPTEGDSAYVPLARTVSTTAPLTGGGALSGNLALGISAFAGVGEGAVPSSLGGTTNFLRADGSWAAPPGAADAVTSVFSRTGAVVAAQADYDSFFLTPAEAGALYSALGHAHATTDITSGTLAVARGGTGLAALGTANQIPGVNAGATALEYKTLTQGSNVTITHGVGTVTIAAAAPPVSSVFTRTGAVVATAGDYTVAQVTGAAPIASPTFTGVPAAPTAAVNTNTTQLATTAYVMAQGYLTSATAASTYAPISTTVTTNTAQTITGAKTFDGAYAAARNAATYAAAQTIDWSTGNVQSITLTGNITSSTWSNPIDGGRYVILLTHSGAGRTVVWPASVKWSGGTAPTLSATGKTDVISCVWNGTNYFCGANLNF